MIKCPRTQTFCSNPECGKTTGICDPQSINQSFLDWNTLTLDQMVEHLENEFQFQSTGTAKCVAELIDFYKKQKGIELSSIGGEEKTLDLGQLFKNNSDCYADTRQTTYDEEVPEEIEGPVIQAMTEERFIEVVSKLAAPSKKGGPNMEEDLGKR